MDAGFTLDMGEYGVMQKRIDKPKLFDGQRR